MPPITLPSDDRGDDKGRHRREVGNRSAERASCDIGYDAVKAETSLEDDADDHDRVRSVVMVVRLAGRMMNDACHWLFPVSR